MGARRATRAVQDMRAGTVSAVLQGTVVTRVSPAGSVDVRPSCLRSSFLSLVLVCAELLRGSELLLPSELTSGYEHDFYFSVNTVDGICPTADQCFDELPIQR